MRCSWPPGNSVTWLNFRYRTIIGRGSCPLLDGGRFAFAYKRERGCKRPGVSVRVGKAGGRLANTAAPPPRRLHGLCDRMSDPPRAEEAGASSLPHGRHDRGPTPRAGRTLAP